MSQAVAEKPKKRHPHRKDYTDQEIDAALSALAICSGHLDKAHALLKDEIGYHVPRDTIRYWSRTSRVERYERIRQQVSAQLQAQMADTHQRLAEGAAELEAKTIERLNERLNTAQVEDKDLANILKNSALSSGIHVDKAQLLNNRPTQIVERPASEVLRALQAKGIDVPEVVEAEVVEDEASA